MSDVNDTEMLQQRVRRALSPVLGTKPYVIVIDRSTLDDLKDESWRLDVYAPEYQSPVTTAGLLTLAQGTVHNPLEEDDETEE